MLERLGDDDGEVRRAAILSLGRVGKGNAQAEEAVLKFTHDPDPATRLDAVVAAAGLGKIDDTVIPTLLEALGAKNESTAKAAGLALTEVGRQHPEKIIPGLVAALKNPDQPSAIQAVTVLARLKGQAGDALPFLAALYDKVRAPQRQQVLDALVMVDTKGDYAIPALVKALDEPDPSDRREALIGLMRFRAEVDVILNPLIKALNDTTEDNRLLAVGIIRGLGEKGAAALPGLMALADDPNSQVRSASIGAIGSLRPSSSPEIMKMLERRIKDHDLRVKLSVIQALRRIGLAHPEEATEILRPALEAESNENVKRSISTVLQALSQPQGDNGRQEAPEKKTEPHAYK